MSHTSFGKSPSPIIIRCGHCGADWWREWKHAFEYYAEGKGIDNVRKKTSQLLHFAGMEVQDIFQDLQDPGPIPEAGDNAYKVAIRKLDSYFRVEGNIAYERHAFRQLALQEGETADQFMTRLRKQARHCNFRTSLNNNLRDQLIEKLTDFELKRKLLEQRNITLEEALDEARAWMKLVLDSHDCESSGNARRQCQCSQDETRKRT